MTSTVASACNQRARHTLADVLAELQQREDLSPARKRHLSYRVEYFCRLLGKVPADIPLDFEQLRGLSAGIDGADLAIAHRTFQNVRWVLQYVLETSALVRSRGSASRQLTWQWRQVLESANPGIQRTHLARLAWFASAIGVGPADVDDGLITVFAEEERRISLLEDPYTHNRSTARSWNALRQRRPELALQLLSELLTRRAAK